MRNILKTIVYFVCFFGIVFHSSAQTKTDSLIASVPHLADSAKVQTLNVLATQFFQKDITKSRQFAEQALEIASTNNFSKGEAESASILCAILNQQGQFALALDMCKRSESIFTRLNSMTGLADVFNRTGMVYNLQGQYPQALENFTKSLKIRQQLNQKERIAPLVENIGMVYFRQEDYKLALDYFNESYKDYLEQNNTASASKILVNIGAAYNRLKMPEQALEAHKKSLEYFEKTNDVIGMGIANNNIGNVHKEIKEYKTALVYYDKSLVIKKKMNDKRGTAVSLKNIAETYLNLNNLEKAKEYIDQSIKIAEEIGAKEQMKDAYDILVKIYEKTKDFKNALSFEKKMASVRDSLFSTDKTLQISRMRAMYETEKAERETEKKDAAIALLNKESEVKASEQNFLVGVVISLLCISILIYFQFTQKKKSHTLLAEKNEVIGKALSERETLLREIHHRVKNNLQIISSLLNLQSKSMEDKASQAAVVESRNRVKSMSMIHEQLYQEDALSGVSMPEYIQHLVESLAHSYGADSERIEWKLDSEAIVLDVDTAIPLGLILNELLTNALKYAFTENHEGQISVSLKRSAEKLLLVVADTGKGIDAKQDKSKNSFGLNLVSSLSKKLRAEMNIIQSNGTRIELTISDFKLVNLKTPVLA